MSHHSSHINYMELFIWSSRVESLQMHAKKYTVPKVHRAKVDSENTGAGKRSGVHTDRQINKSGVDENENREQRWF